MHQVAKQHDEAIKLFHKALQVAPQDGRAWFNLGNSLRDTGQLDEAAKAFLRATEIAPQHANAWRNLGLVLDSESHPQRQPSHARDAFSTAVRLTSRQDPVPLLMQAKLELELRNRQTARSLIKELQALQPTDAQVRQGMDQLQRRLRDERQ
jgi:Tfp pilus assembly protein PilF